MHDQGLRQARGESPVTRGLDPERAHAVTYSAPEPAGGGSIGRIAFPGVGAESADAAAARPRRSRLARGIPLFELVLACGVIGVLTIAGLRAYRQAVMRARATTTAADLAVMRDGVLRYLSDCREFPVWDGRAGDPGLLRAPSTVVGLWGGPYLREWPATTPLGGRYSYHFQPGIGTPTGPVLEAEGLGQSEALELAKALGGGVTLEMAPGRGERREPALWTVRQDLSVLTSGATHAERRAPTGALRHPGSP